MSNSEFQASHMQEISSEEKYKKPKKQMVYEDGLQQGPWTDQQHKKYLMFLSYHLSNKHSMGKKNPKKKKKLFKLMSQFVGTRNLLQCRSHHQKLELKYPSIKTMVEKEKRKYPKENFFDELRQFQDQIKEIYDEGSGTEVYTPQRDTLESHKMMKDIACQTDNDSNQLLMAPPMDNPWLSNSFQLLFLNGMNNSSFMLFNPQTGSQNI